MESSGYSIIMLRRIMLDKRRQVMVLFSKMRRIAEEIISDRKDFNAFTYFSLDQALQCLAERADNCELEEYRRRGLVAGIPDVLDGRNCAVLFRHVATSNYEIQRFAMVADAYPELTPIIFEYQDDTFNDLNEYKHHLGKLRFHKGINKHGELLFERMSIIDFPASNTKPLSSLRTFSGEGLVDLHHRLLKASFPNLVDITYDLSRWLRDIAPSARDYYKTFLKLFVKDAILFENFALDGRERLFTQEVILPAIIDIESECGYKPIIVALEPTEIEGDNFWLSHPYNLRGLLA